MILFGSGKKYPEKSCNEIYEGIGIFLVLADVEWKQMKNNKKGLLYSQARNSL
jgi:hypothetical protein